MRSKLIAVSSGLATLVTLAATAVPALAINHPLVVENGTPVPAGSKFTATNVGTIKTTTSLGTFECSTAFLTGEWTKNETGNVRGNISAAGIGGTGALQSGANEPECTTQAFWGGDTTFTVNPSTNGLPWCFEADRELVEGRFVLRGNSCSAATRPIRLAIDITAVGTCVYQRSTSIPGSFTTSVAESTLEISEQEFTKFEGPFACPGSFKLDMKFALETDGSPFTKLGITS